DEGDHRCEAAKSSVETYRGRRLVIRATVLALPYGTSSNEVHDGQQDDRAQQRHEQARYAEVALIDGRDAEERAQEPATEYCADHSDYDVEKNSLLPVGSHHDARHPSDQS